MKQDSSPVVSSYVCEEPRGNNYHFTQPLVSLAWLGAACFTLVSIDFTRALPLSAGQGQQRNITDYFRISQTQVVAGGMKNRRIKEEPLDPFFIESDDSFSSVSTAMETSGDSCFFLEDEDLVPAPGESSRKRPVSAAAARIHKAEHDLWGELEEKPVVVHPEHSQIKQEHSQIKQELDDMEIEPVPDVHYGLLGTRNWEVPQGSIDELPVEVLRNIFAFLPVTDLYQNLSLVCRCWREIVSDPLVRSAVILVWPHPFSCCSVLSRFVAAFIAVGASMLCLSLFVPLKPFIVP